MRVTGLLAYSLEVNVNVRSRQVHLLPADSQVDGDLPTGAIFELTDRQRDIVNAYLAPVRQRGASPASHQQVAEAIGISRSLVRQECNHIWSAMFLAGIPMRDLADARDQVVDAWIRHRL